MYRISVSTRGHSAKLMKNRCRLDLRRHFFSERVVNRWNGLDQHVIDSATLNSFKTGLDRIRKTSIGFFMDWLSAWPKASPTRILPAGVAAPGKNLVRFGTTVWVSDIITCDNFWRSVEGCRFCRWSKIVVLFSWCTISHWRSQSPLTQCWHYRAARDNFSERTHEEKRKIWLSYM